MHFGKLSEDGAAFRAAVAPAAKTGAADVYARSLHLLKPLWKMEPRAQGWHGNVFAMTEINDLRYPIGKFSRPASNDAATRAAHIQTLRQLSTQVRAAVNGLSDAQLDTPYRDGGWTVRQVVHHLADSHMNAFVRFKLALTEEWPAIKAYDETAWAELPDSKIPIEGSLTFIEALHDRWASLLDAMTEGDFQKGYVHPKSGRQELALGLAIYAWHCDHHTAHITALRARKGW